MFFDRIKDSNSLLKSAQNGDREALNKLIAKYDDVIISCAFKFAQNYDIADDVAQISRLKITRSINSFNNDKANIKTWIYAIVRNTCFDYIRDLKCKKELYISDIIGFHDCLDEDAIESPYTEAALIIDEPIIDQIIDKENSDATSKCVNNILKIIPDKLRIPTELQYKECKEYAEIAQMIGIPEGTVKSRIHKCKILMKEHLINYGYNSS